MLDLEAKELSVEEIELLQDERVGGVILFSRNCSEPKQIQQLCESIHSVNSELIIGVDQEGGRVQRFVSGFTHLPAASEIGLIAEKLAVDALEVSRLCGWLMATEVRSVGADVSFAPVLDIDHGLSKIIGDRAFAKTAEKVIKLAGSYIVGMEQAGMASCGKHFPGHGSVRADSHLELPIDNRSSERVLNEMLPFKALVSVVQGIMPAHVLYPAIDAKNCAGFSSIWIQQILRQELAFNGVVFSDDLSMKGAADYGSYTTRAKKAMDAGCDMILICNQRSAVKEVLNADVLKLNALSSDRIGQLRSSKTRINYLYLEENEQWNLVVNMLTQYQG